MLNPVWWRCNFGLDLTNDFDTATTPLDTDATTPLDTDAATPLDTDAINLDSDAILLSLSRSLESPMSRSSLSASIDHVQALTTVIKQSVNFVINQSSLAPMSIYKQTCMYIVYFDEFTTVTK